MSEHPDLKRIALAKYTDNDLEYVHATDEENVFDADRGVYLVLDDEEADQAVREYVWESLWAFNIDFILNETGIDYDDNMRDSLRDTLSTSCERANGLLQALIAGTCGFDRFVRDAIITDGRGHFLSLYDGEEGEQAVDGKTFYIYRRD